MRRGSLWCFLVGVSFAAATPYYYRESKHHAEHHKEVSYDGVGGTGQESVPVFPASPDVEQVPFSVQSKPEKYSAFSAPIVQSGYGGYGQSSQGSSYSYSSGYHSLGGSSVQAVPSSNQQVVYSSGPMVVRKVTRVYSYPATQSAYYQSGSYSSPLYVQRYGGYGQKELNLEDIGQKEEILGQSSRRESLYEHRSEHRGDDLELGQQEEEGQHEDTFDGRTYGGVRKEVKSSLYEHHSEVGQHEEDVGQHEEGLGIGSLHKESSRRDSIYGSHRDLELGQHEEDLGQREVSLGGIRKEEKIQSSRRESVYEHHGGLELGQHEEDLGQHEEVLGQREVSLGGVQSSRHESHYEHHSGMELGQHEEDIGQREEGLGIGSLHKEVHSNKRDKPYVTPVGGDLELGQHEEDLGQHEEVLGQREVSLGGVQSSRRESLYEHHSGVELGQHKEDVGQHEEGLGIGSLHKKEIYSGKQQGDLELGQHEEDIGQVEEGLGQKEVNLGGYHKEESRRTESLYEHHQHGVIGQKEEPVFISPHNHQGHLHIGSLELGKTETSLYPKQVGQQEESLYPKPDCEFEHGQQEESLYKKPYQEGKLIAVHKHEGSLYQQKEIGGLEVGQKEESLEDLGQVEEEAQKPVFLGRGVEREGYHQTGYFSKPVHTQSITTSKREESSFHKHVGGFETGQKEESLEDLGQVEEEAQKPVFLGRGVEREGYHQTGYFSKPVHTQSITTSKREESSFHKHEGGFETGQKEESLEDLGQVEEEAQKPVFLGRGVEREGYHQTGYFSKPVHTQSVTTSKREESSFHKHVGGFETGQKEESLEDLGQVEEEAQKPVFLGRGVEREGYHQTGYFSKPVHTQRVTTNKREESSFHMGGMEIGQREEPTDQRPAATGYFHREKHTELDIGQQGREGNRPAARPLGYGLGQQSLELGQEEEDSRGQQEDHSSGFSWELENPHSTFISPQKPKVTVTKTEVTKNHSIVEIHKSSSNTPDVKPVGGTNRQLGKLDQKVEDLAWGLELEEGIRKGSTRSLSVETTTSPTFHTAEIQELGSENFDIRSGFSKPEKKVSVFETHKEEFGHEGSRKTYSKKHSKHISVKEESRIGPPAEGLAPVSYGAAAYRSAYDQGSVHHNERRDADPDRHAQIDEFLSELDRDIARTSGKTTPSSSWQRPLSSSSGGSTYSQKTYTSHTSSSGTSSSSSGSGDRSWYQKIGDGIGSTYNKAKERISTTYTQAKDKAKEIVRNVREEYGS